MSSQHDLPISDASQTRQKSCILTPASDSSLNGLASGGKKRKRDGNTMEDLLKDPFIVKPHPSTVFDRPRTLQPLIILPRSQLPLSYLDITSSTNPLPQSRLFDAHVKILELEDRMGTQPMLLIARLDDGKTLYAVEREDRGLYVLCQLGSWVDIQKLASTGTASNNEILATTRRSSGQPRVGLDTETVTAITIEAAKYSKKKRLAIEAIQSMVKRPTTDLLSTSQAAVDSQPVRDTQENSQLTVGPESFESQENNQMTSEPILGDNIAQPTASEIFENVRNQYFEALYLSKASLAYFAKGPLSRARAAFHLDYDSTLEMNDHISFLESLILSTTLIEKKYKDGVPQCVSLIDVHQSEEDADNGNGKPKKKRISKKMKPGKTGLYPLEDVLIRRWWANYDEDAESGGPDSSREETTKRRIADLRIRETQLQMIVLLEVLALQPLASPQDVMEESLPLGLPSATKEEKEKPSKSKKPEHLTMLIDVHIDRLCIWQSIASGSGKIEDSQKENPSQSSTSANVSKHSTDVCRDFCVEVIAPFFSARLPELCSSMNRKLGGPIAVAPSRPRLLSKAASFSSGQSRPGAVTKRPIPPKPGQSLHRVLSETQSRRSASRGPSKAISLMRSASVTVPGLKREASEPVSLSNVPLADSHLFQPSRASQLARRRLSQREADLSSVMPVGISKADKQAKIEAELKEAISALKKPNRELAGKVLAETANQRAATTSRSARKSKKPVRNPLFQTVQISATPKSKRSIDVFSKSQSQRPSMLGNHEEPSPDTIPPSSLPSIPRSAMQPSQEIAQARNQFRTVQATPTRKSAGISSLPQGGRMDAGDYGTIPPSPLHRAHVRRSSAQLFPLPPTKPSGVGASTAVQGTPVKKRSEIAAPASHSISAAIQETPVKRRPEIEAPARVSITTAIRNTPIKQRLDIAGPNHRYPSSEKENTRMGGKPYPTLDAGADDSIYKSLGWDADDDIDDLT